MLVLARSGQRAQALAQYEVCRRRLATEQGVEPSTGTLRLHERIRDGAKALPEAALLLADGGQVERAVERYSLASREPFVANSCWFEDVAGREIAALAATLPASVIAASKARGRARDVKATIAEFLAEWQTLTCP
jgi:hypothetical protein